MTARTLEAVTDDAVYGFDQNTARHVSGLVREAHALADAAGDARGVEEARRVAVKNVGASQQVVDEIAALLPAPSAPSTASGEARVGVCPSCDGAILRGEDLCPVCRCAPAATAGERCAATHTDWTGDFEDNIRCPHCGREDHEHTEYPYKLRHDGDRASCVCSYCDCDFEVTMCVSYTYATEPCGTGRTTKGGGHAR